MARRVAVIGAGWAGCAAALELAASGVPVELFEASRTLGGRARAVWSDGLLLDNGQHILIGAYRETLRLLRRIGSEQWLLRRPLDWWLPGHLHLRVPRLPAPWHLAAALIGARGLTWGERSAALRFMAAMQRRRFTLTRDCTVDALLAGESQPDRLGDLLWRPLCLAALNTPASRASARVFLHVLRDAFAGPRSASDLLLPTADLSALLPDPAAAFVEARGGRIRRQCRVKTIRPDAAGFMLDDAGPYAQVIVAVAPWHLPPLLAAWPQLAATARQAAALASEPITTVWLDYGAGVELARPMLGCVDKPAQWLIDRGALTGPHGLLAAVISASGPHDALDDAALMAAVQTQIAGLQPELPPLRRARVMRIKRATFACTPDLARPATATAVPGLWLAGDHVAGDYPGTLEGAVRSGIAAARAAIAATVGSGR